MIYKVLAFASLLFVSSLSGNSNAWFQYSIDLTVENHTLISVNDKQASEVRIYADKEVYTIAPSAFNDCSFDSLMISSTVKDVQAEYPTSLQQIYFTGSFDEIEFDYPKNVMVYEYSCDEGFNNYWLSFIRPKTDGSTICHVTRQHYVKMKELYNALSAHDKSKVDSKEDGTGTIKDSIKYLDSYFSGRSSSQEMNREIPQTVMIIFILIVASFGMTSIGIFYIFKDKKLIG